ncbi:MAG: hypothetical protein JST04_05905 [Bdellovibrionales bacterium]|nr:hypothetical protein [Bdellovibrionales bacterium]
MSHKFLRQLLCLILLVAFTTIYLNGTRIFAPVDGNSYLSNLRYEGAGNEWNRSLFGDQARWASMENYLRIANEYEMKQNYGLLSEGDEARYYQEFRQMARNALKDWKHYHYGAARDKVAQELDAIPSWYEIRRSKSPPMVVAGILAAAYSGRTLHYRLGDDLSVESRTILHSSHFESQYMGWNSALMGASLGTTYDHVNRVIAMSVAKDVGGGVGVVYNHQTGDDSLGMVYSAGF